MKRIFLIGAMFAGIARSEVCVDGKLPAGNVIVESVTNGVVRLRQDHRDSRPWFYWGFRVTGAEGKTLRFEFTDPYGGGPVSGLGPAVTRDGGRTWSYPAEKSCSHRHFVYTFGADERETWFYQTFQYYATQWDAFLARHAADRGKVFETGVLCQSRKGRSVPCARFGCIGGKPKYRVLYTSRHHCQEVTGTYALEGAVEAVFRDDDLGAWLRENVEFFVVPIVDYDGAIDGDQGKGRRPHDHELDYGENALYPEGPALRRWIATAAQNRIDVALDFHSPWMYGLYNEWIYLCLGPDKANNDSLRRWGRLLEESQDGSLRYRTSCNIPWMFRWNTPHDDGNGTDGIRCDAWQRTLVGNRLATIYEIPFAVANGKTVTPDACRALGTATAKVLRRFLTDPQAGAEAAKRRPGVFAIDEVENLDRYASLDPGLAKAIAFVKGCDVEKLPVGRHEIDGQKVVATVRNVRLVAAEAAVSETTADAYELHLPLTAPEVILVDGKDYGVGPRQFVLFEPGVVPHATGCSDDPQNHADLRKLVILAGKAKTDERPVPFVGRLLARPDESQSPSGHRPERRDASCRR